VTLSPSRTEGGDDAGDCDCGESAYHEVLADGRKSARQCGRADDDVELAPDRGPKGVTDLTFKRVQDVRSKLQFAEFSDELANLSEPTVCPELVGQALASKSPHMVLDGPVSQYPVGGFVLKVLGTPSRVCHGPEMSGDNT
jgi:hypothetical protein